MLPDCLVPYKHYNEETISGVLDDIVNPDDEDSEIYPSEKTMLRWHHWFILNQFNIEGHMKSIGYRLLGFKEELLKFSNSLLGHIKSSMPDVSVISHMCAGTQKRFNEKTIQKLESVLEISIPDISNDAEAIIKDMEESQTI